jgi:hypothetical protein
MKSVVINADASRYNLGVRADCYVTAIRLALSVRSQNGTGEAPKVSDGDFIVIEGAELVPYVCHGVVRVNSKRSKEYGWRVTHAWVELVDPDDAIVVDASVVGMPTQMNTRAGYYRSARVNGDLVRRYSVRDALKATVDCGHNGPWEPPLDVAVDYRRDCELGGGRPSYKLLGDVTGESGLCG